MLTYHKNLLSLFLTFFYLGLLIEPTKAQTTAPAGSTTTQIPQGSIAQPRIPRLAPPENPTPERLPQQTPTPQITQPEQPSGIETPVVESSDPESIKVTEFRLVGNTAFSTEKLQTITDKYVNKKLSNAQLVEVASRIALLYYEEGYVTSGAVTVVPEATQTQKQGVVEIQIIEGELEKIEVSPALESMRLNTDYISSRIAIAAGKPLNINRLQEALQLLQLNPLISGINATLSTGSRPGTSILQVKVTESPSFRAQFFIDNNRDPSVRTFERGFQITESNLTGLGDEIDLVYANTNGSNRVDVSYSLPLTPYNTTLELGYNFDGSRVVEEPFDQLDIRSESHYYEIALRQPIIQSVNQGVYDNFSLALTGSFRDTHFSLLGESFPLSPGADEDGNIRISAIRFSQEWVRQDTESVFALRSEFNFGLNALGSTVVDQPQGLDVTWPTSEFFAWRFQSQWVKLLAPNTVFLIRGNGQISSDALFSSEQISIGGTNSVRGYRQDEVLTDNGFVISTEVRIPILEVPQANGILQIIPFFDYGIGWNNANNPDPDPQSLAGIGVGLQWRQGEVFNVRIDYGIPLIEVKGEKNTWQENGIYLRLEWNFF